MQCFYIVRVRNVTICEYNVFILLIVRNVIMCECGVFSG